MTKERKPLTPEGKARIMAAENPNYITPKQQAFIKHYMANGNNGTKAAIAAGYSERSARVTACELLKMEKIQKRMQPAQEEQKERLELDADWIISRLMKEAGDADNSEAARVRALELLGKVEGIFAPDKKQIETINGGDFLANLDLSDDDERDTVQ
jgi:phage terminase small subunit